MRIRLALVSIACLGALASTAAADPDQAATEMRVSSAGVDFSRPEATKAFYAALDRAARQACDSGMKSLQIRARDRVCAAAALDRAVQTAANPALGALHAQMTGRKAPPTVLAAR